MQTDFLTIEDVARRLNVAGNTVRNAIKRGRLVAYKFLGTYRINQEDLDAFVEASRIRGKRQEAKAPAPKASTLTHLDGERLRAAWIAQGIRVPRTDVDSVPSSGSTNGPSGARGS